VLNTQEHSPLKTGNYDRQVLFSNALFEVVQCTWAQGAAAPFHSHDSSDCYFMVEEGEFENTSYSGLETSVQKRTKNEVIHIPIYTPHEMKCLSPQGRTLHIYLPPITKTAAKDDSATEKRLFRTRTIAEIESMLPLVLGKTGISSLELQSVFAKIRQQSISVHSEYFMNQLFAGIVPEAVQAQELIASTKATMATFEASTIFTVCEIELIKAMGELIGWNAQDSEGISVPGGSAANFMSLHCARQRLFPDIKTEGNGNRSFKVFVSEHSHYSWKKACMALGLGTNSIVFVKTDQDGHLSAEDLKTKIIEVKNSGAIPLLVGATAGTTVYGAFDPLESLGQICKYENIWFHVDAAWGGPVLFSKTSRHLMKGVELADSLTFDAHKLLGTSLTCSFFLTRHRTILQESNDVTGADYLFHEEGEVKDRGRMSWQCGRQADVFSFWTLWKKYGSDGFGEFVDRQLALKDDFVSYIKTQERCHLVKDAEFLNVCVQIIPPNEKMDTDTWSKKVRDRLKEEDLAMVNYSTDENGLTFIRFILAHPHLKLSHLQEMIQWSLQMGTKESNLLN
jgi:glutamate/tyrosine decarboxylase-like PLP-dependent enzyme/quercetin dioxygenase-like cupin family protein